MSPRNASNVPHISETPEQREVRLAQDEQTVYVMAQMFCKAHHADAAKDELGLCEECREVVEYSFKRTRSCPFEHMGNCDACTIHCYAPAKREKIRAIMAWAGPRMLTTHPVMAIRHLKKKIAGKMAAKKAVKQG